MIIHVIQPGETLDTIADIHGVSVERLALENGITEPDRLVVGETIVILYPEQTYVIQEGDTLNSIAEAFGVDAIQLLQNNPYLSDQNRLPIGEMIVISYFVESSSPLTVNGYAYSFINQNILKKTLPFLTYLTIFSYQITSDGELIPIEDEEIIQLAKEYKVAPIMLISPLSTLGDYDRDFSHRILTNTANQNQLIYETMNFLKTKGYYGLCIDFQYVAAEDRLLFTAYIERFASIVQEEGFQVYISISPTLFEIETGVIFEGYDYSILGQITDGTILMNYEWCTIQGFPPGILPLQSLQNYLDFVVSQIDPRKLSLAFSTMGYIWQLPIDQNSTTGNLISSKNALELARDSNTEILFNASSENPYFYFTFVEDYFVWFRDARSLDTHIDMVSDNSMNGVVLWNIMLFIPQAWLVIIGTYHIVKINSSNPPES